MKDHGGRTLESPGVVSNQAPYEPPRVTFDEVLEVVAATCTSAGSKGDFNQCPSAGGAYKT